MVAKPVHKAATSDDDDTPSQSDDAENEDSELESQSDDEEEPTEDMLNEEARILFLLMKALGDTCMYTAPSIH